MSTALVTGAAGFIGSHVVEQLLDRDYRVRGLDNCSTGTKNNLATVTEDSAFRLIEGDVRDEDVVSRAAEGVDALFHLAAYTSVPGSFERAAHVSDVNCAGTATVLDAAVAAGVESVVLASSAAVYGSDAPVPVDESTTPQPESPYASSKLYAEQLGQQFSEEYGLNVASLRFFNVYGHRQDPNGEYAAVIAKFSELLLTGKRPVIFGDGEQTRDFVFVTDVADACVAASTTNSTGVYNIASGKRVSINTLVDRLNSVCGTNLTPVYEDPRQGDIRHSAARITNARETFGFDPAVGLDEGLAATVTNIDESVE